MRKWVQGGIGLAGMVAIAGAVTLWPAGADEAAAPGLLPYRDVVAVAEGAELYQANCASCHGADLAGEADWQTRGPDGMLPAPPHDPTGHTWHHPDSMLIGLTAQGPAALIGNGYESAMPGFGDTLSEAEILAVLAYIKSTWPDEVIEIHNQINADAVR